MVAELTVECDWPMMPLEQTLMIGWVQLAPQLHNQEVVVLDLVLLMLLVLEEALAMGLVA